MFPNSLQLLLLFYLIWVCKNGSYPPTPCSVFLSWVDIIDGLFVEDNYDKVRSLYVLDRVWKCAN